MLALYLKILSFNWSLHYHLWIIQSLQKVIPFVILLKSVQNPLSLISFVLNKLQDTLHTVASIKTQTDS